MIEPENVKRFERNMRAMIDLASDDPESFAAIAKIFDEAELRMQHASAELRRQGFSFSDMGRALGVSRQAAWKKYGQVPQ